MGLMISGRDIGFCNNKVASGDTDTWEQTAGGGYKKDAWIMQWQTNF